MGCFRKMTPFLKNTWIFTELWMLGGKKEGARCTNIDMAVFFDRKHTPSAVF